MGARVSNAWASGSPAFRLPMRMPSLCAAQSLRSATGLPSACSEGYALCHRQPRGVLGLGARIERQSHRMNGGDVAVEDGGARRTY